MSNIFWKFMEAISNAKNSQMFLFSLRWNPMEMVYLKLANVSELIKRCTSPCNATTVQLLYFYGSVKAGLTDSLASRNFKIFHHI